MDKIIAQWIGAHLIEFLLILSLVTLAIIFSLWRGIENYHQALWQLGNRGWRYFKGSGPPKISKSSPNLPSTASRAVMAFSGPTS